MTRQLQDLNIQHISGEHTAPLTMKKAKGEAILQTGSFTLQEHWAIVLNSVTQSKVILSEERLIYVGLLVVSRLNADFSFFLPILASSYIINS